MKKSLVFAMAMALGVTASAYAANPFSDVPAGHWAYDSISKLAAAGIIEGYGDDTFRGDRLMTRYEMAQIVAKAFAKGANIDRLAAEFADELDALGVRVTALEKKSDNVKITGYFRYDYASNDNDEKGKSHRSKLRTRLWFNGKVNDSWNYIGMLQNDQDLTNNIEDGETKFQRAYLQGRLGGVKITAGRANLSLVDSEIYGCRFDGIQAKYGDKIKLGAYYGKPTDQEGNFLYADENDKKWKFDRMWGINGEAELGKIATLSIGYDKAYNGSIYTDKGFVDKNADYEDDIFNAGLTFKIGNYITLGGTYLHTDLDDELKADGASDNGFFVKATYKGAKASKPGSWGLTSKYYHMPAGAVIANGWDYANPLSNNLVSEGFKGWYAQGRVTIAKNMIGGIQFWNLKGRESDITNKTVWSDLVVTF